MTMLTPSHQRTQFIIIVVLAGILSIALSTLPPVLAFQGPPPRMTGRRRPSVRTFYQETEKEHAMLPPLVDAGEGGGAPDTVAEVDEWVSATRTIGSLLLRQEDAARGNRNATAAAADPDAATTEAPFGPDENSFARYLLDLKLREEDNRERAKEENRLKKRPKNKATKKKPGLLNFRVWRPAEEEQSTGPIIDPKISKELDESVAQLPLSIETMQDMEVLPCSLPAAASVDRRDLLQLSYPEHYKDRIGRDMRHLSVSIAASIDEPWQWKLFFDEGGGVQPLLECIRDGAHAVEAGGAARGAPEEGARRAASLTAACTACRALRDLSAQSRDCAAVVTDDILRVNAQWSSCVVEGGGHDCSAGGLVSDLLILLRHANEAEAFGTGARGTGAGRRAGFSLSERRKRRDARRRCGLYVVQLLLAMVVASDEAVTTLRSTSGLIEAVVDCSSYASSERFKRKWIRKPVRVVRSLVPGRRKRKPRPKSDVWLEEGVTGQVQQNANKLLAAIGYNEWIPKLPGQKGLRVLCLDGGGTRGIAAVTSLRHLVKAMNGVEVCDAFDMIVGTSTGAIVGFLVGLRRESAADARIRYDTLIKRIFIKSKIAPIMLAATTASYDEANLMNVLQEILKDDGMLDSRANPAVPLIAAVSSKMSSSPSQLCLLRNYNYGGGEMTDAFQIDPNEARQRLELEYDTRSEDMQPRPYNPKRPAPIKCAPRTGKGSRYPGSFRVTQKIALRATTAAPSFFKPLLSFNELYVDGGIVASNPSAIAVHEAKTLFPGVPLELLVSVGTGAFSEIRVPPRVGWDGVVAQILDSATDAEQVHHVLEDVFGDGKTAQHKGRRTSSTKYFRFNPIVGDANTFPIDEIDEGKLQGLCDIVDEYMAEEEQKSKLKQLGDIVHPKSWIQRAIQCSIEKNV